MLIAGGVTPSPDIPLAVKIFIPLYSIQDYKVNLCVCMHVYMDKWKSLLCMHPYGILSAFVPAVFLL